MRQAIDAGHGWHNKKQGVFDPGAVNGIYFEHNLNAELAHMVDAELQGYEDVRTLLIESGLLYSRDNRAASWNADQYAAIHFDSFDQTVSGTTVFTNRGKGVGSAEYVMAHRVGRALALAQGIPFRGVRQMDFAVLAGRQPDILIEVCFMSNNAELANYIAKKREVAHAIASALAHGIDSKKKEEEDDMQYDHEKVSVHLGTDAKSLAVKAAIKQLADDNGKAAVVTPTFRDSWRGWLGTKL